MSWLSRNFGETAKSAEKTKKSTKSASPISLHLPAHDLAEVRKVAAWC